jgi:hypothetical protein
MLFIKVVSSRWTKKFDIWNMRRMYCPINVNGDHWTLVVAFMEEKKVCYYDSMSRCKKQDIILDRDETNHYTARRYINGMLRFIGDETMAKKGETFDDSMWTRVLVATPQQGFLRNGEWKDGVNCGIFTILFADFVTDDVPFTFVNSDIQMFRRKVAAAIIRGYLDYDDEPGEQGEHDEKNYKKEKKKKKKEKKKEKKYKSTLRAKCRDSWRWGLSLTSRCRHSSLMMTTMTRH